MLPSSSKWVCWFILLYLNTVDSILSLCSTKKPFWCMQPYLKQRATRLAQIWKVVVLFEVEWWKSEQEFGWMQVKSTKGVAHKCEAFIYDVFGEKVRIFIPEKDWLIIHVQWLKLCDCIVGWNGSWQGHRHTVEVGFSSEKWRRIAPYSMHQGFYHSQKSMEYSPLIISLSPKSKLCII